jgi:hypothetical protein
MVGGKAGKPEDLGEKRSKGHRNKSILCGLLEF